MATTHITALRNTLANAAVDSLDGGSTDANGDMVFLTAADAEVAVCALTNPAFGAAASGIATAASIAESGNATAGTVTKYHMRDRDNDEQFGGSVTATGGGGDVELSSVVFADGDKVQVSSFTYTAAP